MNAQYFLHSVLDAGRWALDVLQWFAGGVAERLIAPVLKTGRPKGLVSSNLTPSGQLSFEFQLAIADFQEEEVHHDNCA